MQKKDEPELTSDETGPVSDLNSRVPCARVPFPTVQGCEFIPDGTS